MTSRIRTAAVAALALLFSVSSSFGQELVAGTWTGTVAPPDEEIVSVEYEVAYDEEGALQISLVPPAGLGAPPLIPFEDIQLSDGVLTFGWGVEDTWLTCEMVRQEDGSFEGECVDESGEPGYLTMVPPGT